MTSQSPPSSKTLSPLYRHYLLFLCCFSFFIAFLDRQVFAALMPSLKKEFGFSDTILGLLSGLSFAVTYSLLALPLGRLADRVNRKWLLMGCVTVWSTMTFLCGAAGSLIQLMAARMGVGAGEAGVTPSAVPIISDLYDQRYRARAIALYPIAGALGLTAAFPLGGYLADEYGWRTAFHIVSIPGFLLVILLWLTFRDPTRGHGQTAQREQIPTIREAAHAIVTNRQLLMVLGAGALGAMITAVNTWLPSFFERSHGLSPVRSGVILGPVLGLATVFGMFLGGWLIDKVGARHGENRVLFTLSLIAVLQGGCAVGMLASPNLLVSFLFTALWGVASAAWAPATFALCQSLVETRMRGLSLALMGLLNNVVGYGLGPLLAGMVSERLRADSGPDSLRWALIGLSVTLAMITALLYALGARPKAPRYREAIVAGE